MPEWVASPTINLPDLDIVGIAAIVVAIGVILALARGVNRFFKKANQVLDDWNGTPAENGHEEQPGVIQHFKNLDRELGETKQSLGKHIDDENERLVAMGAEVSGIKAKVDHELGRNSGSTTKDAAHEALRVVKEVQVQQEAEIIARRQDRDEYRADQLAHDARLMTFFALIRRMITLSPPEQIDLWDDATQAFAEGRVPDLPDTEETA